MCCPVYFTAHEGPYAISVPCTLMPILQDFYKGGQIVWREEPWWPGATRPDENGGYAMCQLSDHKQAAFSPYQENSEAGLDGVQGSSQPDSHGWKQNLTFLSDDRGLRVLNICICDILLVTSLVCLTLSSQEHTFNYKAISTGSYDLLYEILLCMWLPEMHYGEKRGLPADNIHFSGSEQVPFMWFPGLSLRLLHPS